MLGWGKILDYLGRRSVIIGALISGTERLKREPERWGCEKAFTGFEDGRRSHEPRNAGSL